MAKVREDRLLKADVVGVERRARVTVLAVAMIIDCCGFG